jgi:hypothetical protein
VGGADSIDARPGFSAALTRIASNGAKTIIVETENRFARDLMVQEVGFVMLRDLGIALVAADSPASFLDDGPTSKLIRPILGAVSEFYKAMTVAKLKGARDRVRRQRGKCEGRKSYAERDPELVDLARWLHHNVNGRPYSLREVAAELAGRGYVTPSGKHYSARPPPFQIETADARVPGTQAHGTQGAAGAGLPEVGTEARRAWLP